MKTRHILPAALLLACMAPAGAQQRLPGERLFSIQCASCHSPKPGEWHRLGPNLHGVIGRAAGSAPGMKYSPPFLRAMEGKVWDAELLDRWLANPQSLARGTTMVYSEPDPGKRRAIIEYLQTLKP